MNIGVLPRDILHKLCIVKPLLKSPVNTGSSEFAGAVEDSIFY